MTAGNGAARHKTHRQQETKKRPGGRSFVVAACWLGFGIRYAGKGWQRRTLPRGRPRSTIRARELNCRVRDGTGWTLTALATNARPRLASARCYAFLTTDIPARKPWFSRTSSTRRPFSPQHTHKTPSTFSTGRLQTLLPFHLRPIQLVVSQRSYPVSR